MAHITLTGELLKPVGDGGEQTPDIGAQMRFTHRTTTGDTIKYATDIVTFEPPSAAYTIDVEYGLVYIEYRPDDKCQFKPVGQVVVNQDNPATNLPELLNAVVPVSDEVILEMQAILADAVTAQEAAEDAADRAEAVYPGGITAVGANSVDDMIAGLTSSGVTVEHFVGQRWKIYSGWIVSSISSPMTIANFKADWLTSALDFPDSGEITSQSIQSAIDANNSALIPSGSHNAEVAINNLRFGVIEGQGPTLTDINANGGAPFIDYDGGRYDEMKLSRARIIGPGEGDASGAACIFMDGEVNTTRELFSQLRIQDWPTGIQLNSGWGRRIDQCLISSCSIGVGSGASIISPSVSGSGTTIMDSYISSCDTGIDDTAQWNMLLINTIIENCETPYIQNQGGNGRTLINPWFESNANPTQWRSGSVVINGRGVEFTDVSLTSSSPEDAIIWLDRSSGLRVFRQSPDSAQFWADGEGVKGFSPVRENVGFEIIDNNETDAKLLNMQLGGGVTATTSGANVGPVKLSTLTGKAHYYSSQLESMPEVGFSVYGQTASSNNGGGITTCRVGTGRYNSGGGSGTDIEERWEWDSSGHYEPLLDATYDIGSTNRVRDLRIENSPIVGSSYKIKDDISSIPQEMLDFALSVELKQYKLKNGERNHYGIIIDEDFLYNLGLITDLDYCAAFCKDVFTDEAGNPIERIVNGVTLGELWQVRYDEWQNILLEAMRRKINEI